MRIGFLILALAGIAYLGTFTRFHGDDFCMATDAAQIGLTGMLAKWYTTWTGRYMFIVGTGFLSLGGPGFCRLAACPSRSRLAGWHKLGDLPPDPAGKLAPSQTTIGHPWRAWPGRVVVFRTQPVPIVLLAGWSSQITLYPLIGLTFSCGLILRAWLQPKRTWGSAMGVFVLSFVSGGFTESYSAFAGRFIRNGSGRGNHSW